MKKYMTKPVLAVVTAVGLIGCVTPMFADANAIIAPSATKVVMNDEGKSVTRYNLKELAKNDPTTLNMLLKNQMEHLYIIVDEINLDTKLQSYMENNKDEWTRIYNDYYSDIWLEVRLPDQIDQIVSVSAKTENDKVYLKGIVSSDVTKVIVKKPNADIIEVIPTNERSFTVSFAAPNTSSDAYVTIFAYEGTKLVDSEKVKIVQQAEEEKDMLIHTVSVLDAKKTELKVKGIVKQGADKVVVTYNGVKKEAGVKKLWDGVGSFSVTIKDSKLANGQDKALVEVFEDGNIVDSETVQIDIVKTPEKEQPTSYALKGTAVNNPENKSIQLTGTVTGWNKSEKMKLFVIAADGKKKEIKPNDKGEFSLKLSYKDREYNAKSVRIELVKDNKVVKQSDIAITTKVIVQPDKHNHKHPKGKAHGYWKKHDKDDDDQDDDDDDDDDRRKKGRDDDDEDDDDRDDRDDDRGQRD